MSPQNNKMICSLNIARLCSLFLLSMIVAGCNTMADLERERSVVIEWRGQEGIGGSGINRSQVEGQEGIGGTGLDPGTDGIGGTGIIGQVTTNGAVSVGGVEIPQSDTVSVFIAGEAASLATLTQGQLAAVYVDGGNTIQQVHVFDGSSGPPRFLGKVAQLVVTGEIGQFDHAGIRVPTAISSAIKPGEKVQIRANAMSSGVFQVQSVKPLQVLTPQVLPELTAPPQSVPATTPTGGPTSRSSKPVNPVMPATPIQPSQPDVILPAVNAAPPMTSVPAPVETIRPVKVEPAIPPKLPIDSIPISTPASSSVGAVQSVTPSPTPTVVEPPTVPPASNKPQAPDAAMGILAPADTSATRP